MVNLEKWKKRSGSKLKQWLDSIGEIEVLNSFAIIYFENPDWIMPEVLQTPNTFESEKIGHPLIKDRVCNDLSLDYKTRILLITGSNMSGKSTLLRTVGVNLVFAYAGGPVCAKKFSCSVMELYSCMRINDSLKENISSFYAELLKIKKIIEAAKNKENVFCLLDEIFKGTNSKDRNIGAKILINKLINEKVLGLISTHDLELGNMEKLSDGKIKNYNFREFFKNNEIYFDYKLRKGISKTTNALYLMKIAGVYET